LDLPAFAHTDVTDACPPIISRYAELSARRSFEQRWPHETNNKEKKIFPLNHSFKTMP